MENIGYIREFRNQIYVRINTFTEHLVGMGKCLNGSVYCYNFAKSLAPTMLCRDQNT